MIVGDVFREREIERREALLDEQGEVGVVRQEAIDLRIERTRCVVGKTLRIEGDKLGIAWAGLKQKAAAARAPRLNIHHRADARL